MEPPAHHDYLVILLQSIYKLKEIHNWIDLEPETRIIYVCEISNSLTTNF